jgi:hypothetical protein
MAPATTSHNRSHNIMVELAKPSKICKGIVSRGVRIVGVLGSMNVIDERSESQKEHKQKIDETGVMRLSGLSHCTRAPCRDTC